MDVLLSDSDDDERNFPRLRNFRQRQYFELENFEERFRLSRTQCEDLLLHIGPDCVSPTGRSMALSPADKLLMALRFYASGGFYYSVGDANGPSKASVCRAVHRVTAAVNRRLFQATIRWPNPVGTLANRFHHYANMPCVAGAVDGTLVEILAPTEYEDQFVDRHGTHSINAMFVCGPNLRFYAASVRWPGAVNDARVLRNSVLRRRFENGWRPFDRAIILGDSAYPLSDWLMPPIARPINDNERRYNQAHRKTRRLIECAFGSFKESFQCLKRLRVKSPLFACEIIKACAVLHNLRLPDEDAAVEDDDDDGLHMSDFGLETEAPTEDSTDEDGAVDVEGRAAALARQAQIVQSFAVRL